MAVRFCVYGLDDDGEHPMDLADDAFDIVGRVGLASGRAWE